jgi:hypothetical protein
MTWFEVSGADAESGKQGHPTDPWETASVASVNTTSASATKKRGAPKAGVRASRKSAPKQVFFLRPDIPPYLVSQTIKGLYVITKRRR